MNSTRKLRRRVASDCSAVKYAESKQREGRESCTYVDGRHEPVIDESHISLPYGAKILLATMMSSVGAKGALAPELPRMRPTAAMTSGAKPESSAAGSSSLCSDFFAPKTKRMVLPTTTSRRLHQLAASALLCAQNTHVALGLATTSHFRDHTHHHHAQTVDSRGFTYDYSRHGSDWVQGMCSSTERQSPVSLTTAGLASTGKLVYSYVPLETGFSMQNNGHTITADFMGLGVGGLSYNNGWYNLMSVNFHSPSEHVYDGVHYPLEAHLVHKRSDSDHLVIVAVPFAAGGGGAGSSAGSNSGSSSQTATAAFLQQKKSSGSQESSEKSGPSPLSSFALGIPESVGQTLFAAPPVDFMGFYGEKDFVEYGGSLTAPPCAETATWFVRKEAVDGGGAEVAKFQNAILAITNGMGNNRNTMPMNGRPVAMRTAVAELPAAARGPASMGSGLATMSSAEKTANREYQALMWAKEAMDEAKAAKQYAQILDEKLRAQGAPDVGTPAGSAAVATPGDLASTAAATVTQIATPL